MGRVLRPVNGVLRMRDVSTVVYDENTVIGVGGVATGSPLTLPLSQTYTSDELEIYLNGSRMDIVLDYNYVGTAPRTQISFTFDLLETDVVRFRINTSI